MLRSRKTTAILSSLSVCLLIAFLLVQCSDTSTSSTQKETTKPVENEYAYVGEHHNEALDYVLNNLQSVRGKAHSDELRAAYMEQAKALTREYLRNNNFPAIEYDAVQTGFEIGQSRSYKTASSGFSANKSLGSVIADADLSATQKKLLQRIKDALYSTDQLPVLENELNAINAAASEQLSTEDARVVFAASSVGYHSAKYWKENWVKWQQKFANAKYAEIAAFDWGEVGANDVGGAVGGAVGATITGCAELTLGACAGVGALGGAAGGSVANAITQLF